MQIKHSKKAITKSQYMVYNPISIPLRALVVKLNADFY